MVRFSLDQEYCDRCHTELTGRIMSWFTEEIICIRCSSWERVIIDACSESESSLEGIGSIPKVDFEVNWGKDVPDEYLKEN